VADLTYTGLQKAITALEKDIRRSADDIRAWAQYINDEAIDTARVAETIAAIGVDPDTIAETHEVAKLMAGLSEAAIAYASASDTTAKTASAARDQARASHEGIKEAYSRAPADVSRLKRAWLTPQ
jgi:hypothetical protein